MTPEEHALQAITELRVFRNKYLGETHVKYNIDHLLADASFHMEILLRNVNAGRECDRSMQLIVNDIRELTALLRRGERLPSLIAARPEDNSYGLSQCCQMV
jgi:hypothetical protein